MEIEANIPPPGIRLNKKIRNYTSKVIQIEENHLIRARIPIFFFFISACKLKAYGNFVEIYLLIKRRLFN